MISYHFQSGCPKRSDTPHMHTCGRALRTADIGSWSLWTNTRRQCQRCHTGIIAAAVQRLLYTSITKAWTPRSWVVRSYWRWHSSITCPAFCVRLKLPKICSVSLFAESIDKIDCCDDKRLARSSSAESWLWCMIQGWRNSTLTDGRCSGYHVRHSRMKFMARSDKEPAYVHCIGQR
jgi:hypothetical protein